MNARQPTSTASPPVIGQHVLLDLYGVDETRLTDASNLTGLLERNLDAHGFHRLASSSHQFPGDGAGATVMVLLSESHATIHTYPEHQYAAVDVFCCGDANIDGFVKALIDELQPSRVTRRDNVRGGE